MDLSQCQCVEQNKKRKQRKICGFCLQDLMDEGVRLFTVGRGKRILQSPRLGDYFSVLLWTFLF